MFGPQSSVVDSRQEEKFVKIIVTKYNLSKYVTVEMGPADFDVRVKDSNRASAGALTRVCAAIEGIWPLEERFDRSRVGREAPSPSSNRTGGFPASHVVGHINWDYRNKIPKNLSDCEIDEIGFCG